MALVLATVRCDRPGCPRVDTTAAELPAGWAELVLTRRDPTTGALARDVWHVCVDCATGHERWWFGQAAELVETDLR